MSSPENRHAQAPKQTNYDISPSSDAASTNDADRAFFDAQMPNDLSGFDTSAKQEWIEHPRAGQPRVDGFGNNPQTVHYSEYRPTNEKQSVSNRTKAIIGALTVSTAIGGWIGYNKLNEAKQVMDLYGALNNIPTTAQTADDIVIGAGPATEMSVLEYDYNNDGVVNGDDYDLMPPSTYAELDEAVRIEDCAAKLKQYLPSAWNIVQPILSAEERSFLYMPDLSKPPKNWSDQDYSNYAVLGIYLVSSQGNTQAQIDEGKRALAAVVNPDDKLYDQVYDKIGNAGAQLYSIEALPSPMSGVELTTGTTIDGVTVTTDGGRLVRSKWYYGDHEAYLFYVNRRDNQGNVVPVLARTFKPSDPELDRFIG